jgi:hypothetical protein
MPKPCLYHNENINIILFDTYVSYAPYECIYRACALIAQPALLGWLGIGEGILIDSVPIYTCTLYPNQSIYYCTQSSLLTIFLSESSVMSPI